MRRFGTPEDRSAVNALVFPAIVVRRICDTHYVREHMNGNEACFICRRVDSQENLGAWFVHDERLPVHLECWLGWYEQRTPRGRAPGRESNPPGQHDSEEAS